MRPKGVCGGKLISRRSLSAECWGVNLTDVGQVQISPAGENPAKVTKNSICAGRKVEADAAIVRLEQADGVAGGN